MAFVTEKKVRGGVIHAFQALKVGSDDAPGIAGLLRFQATLTPASVAAATVAHQAHTFTGLLAGDIVLAVEKPTEQAGLGVIAARVSAANTVQLSFINPTVAAIVPTAAQVYIVWVLRPSS